MTRYTAIAIDHRVEVGGFVGARVVDDSAHIFFSNSEAQDGMTVAEIPLARFNGALGMELARWLLVTLESITETSLSVPVKARNSGERIKADEVCVPMFSFKSAGGRRWFELMVSDVDSEMVLVTMPESAAIEALGERLCNRLADRGQFINVTLIDAINKGMAGLEENK